MMISLTGCWLTRASVVFAPSTEPSGRENATFGSACLVYRGQSTGMTRQTLGTHQSNLAQVIDDILQLFLVNGDPVALCDSSCPRQLAAGIAPSERENIEGLARPPGVPVVRILQTVYDSDYAAVEVQETIAAADKHQLRYEVAMR